MATAAVPVVRAVDKRVPAGDIVRGLISTEMVFGVVGPVGSGTSEVAEALEEFLDRAGYEAKILKARDVITAWAAVNEIAIPTCPKMAQTQALQDAGDRLRFDTRDNAAVALRLIRDVRSNRAGSKGEHVQAEKAVEPDDKLRAYVLDSLRNPAEIDLLRHLYQQSFCLIGVVCDEETREVRLADKYRDAGKEVIEKFMARDEKAAEKHGQQVAETFHHADFFVDNSAPRYIETVGGAKNENPDWTVLDELGRLVDILTHARVVRPRANEFAMYHAHGAKMRSACLSRQVGAALMDSGGNVVSTGTNEVPRAGGGVYGGVFAEFTDSDPDPEADHRCAFSGGYCRNTREQNAIIEDLFNTVEELKGISLTQDLKNRFRKTRIGQLMEYSRSIHAEMDTLLSAARQGCSTVGARLFVTTFPCHNCARHIVTAGVDEVQFIEPFLKSKALSLHGDSITTSKTGWVPPSSLDTNDSAKSLPNRRVLFRPFTGVAPRLYRRAFYKDRELKDGINGDLLKVFPERDGTGADQVMRQSYAQVEARLISTLDPREL